MKTSKKIIYIFLIALFIIAIISQNSKVYGNWFTDLFSGVSYSEIEKKYNENKNVINTLTDEELEQWENEVDKMKKLMNSPDGSGFTKEDKDKANEISRAITDRRRKENVSSDKQNGTGESNKDLKDYDIEEITKWLEKNDPKYLSKEVKDKWKKTIEKSSESEDYKKQAQLLLEGKTLDEVGEQLSGESSSIYVQPGQTSSSTSGSLDDMIGDAESFLRKGNKDPIKQGSLQAFSKTLYNILLTIGIAVAVIAGLIIGIRFMLGSVEDKANIKELLIPYVIGCVVVFGAFTIWKIVVTVLNQM